MKTGIGVTFLLAWDSLCRRTKLGRYQDVAFVSRHGVADESSNRGELAAAQILDLIKIAVGADVFELWLGNGQCINVIPGEVNLRFPNEFHLNRVLKNHGDEIRKAIQSQFGGSMTVNFGLNEDATADSFELPKSQPEPNDRIANSGATHQENFRRVAPAKPKKGLHNFCFSDSNLLAEAGVRQMFGQLGQMSPLVFYGPTGCGKTHLLEGIVSDARHKHKLKRCVYLSAEQFTGSFVEALRGTGLPVFRRKYRDLDLLAIDDVQFFAGKSATLAEFQYTLDSLIRAGKQVVLASERPPVDLGELGSEITARMMSGLVTPLNYPDVQGRTTIFRRLCLDRGYDVPDDVVQLVSQNMTRDVRRLSGAANRMHALSVATGKSITVETAKESLTDLFAINGSITSIKAIEKVVCNFCGLKPSELKSSSRQKKVSAARMLAMYLSRHYTKNACSEIGDYFGGRSHSTVIAAEKKVAVWLKGNQAIDLPHAKYLAKDAVVRIESDLRIG
ncbi:MAG: DnaA/Hda family protein [Planctomycetota bacterium]